MAPTIILLDIEGTTTPVSFVYEVLFPFARERARGFLLEHWHRSEPDHDIRADLARLTEENRQDRNTGFNPPALSEDSREKTGYIESVVAYVHWLMDQDRKSTGLKSLQGKIWDEGYRSGLLVGEVFDDVPRAFERWQRRGKRICIFSSGSVFAQQLLFSRTRLGDLTGYISEYFDTNVGAKTEDRSYRKIAAQLRTDAHDIMFVSDLVLELNAARVAGMETVLCVRPGNRPQPVTPETANIETFDELFP